MESIHKTLDATNAWENHVCHAAKSFLMCAVVIDDRPFSDSKPSAMSGTSQSDTTSANQHESQSRVHGPLPSVRKAVTPKAGVVQQTLTQPQTTDSGEERKQSSDTHNLDLRTLTDSFAEEGIICGTLIPDNLRVGNDTPEYGEKILIERAQNMAKTADILIIDWYLKKQNYGTTLNIINAVLQADKQEGGRTRLICIYTGEDQLEILRGITREHLFEDYGLEANPSEDVISLTNQNTSIIFYNKKTVDNPYSVPEKELPSRLIRAFASLIDGLLPSFAASSIGAIRRNTHAILSIFDGQLDPAYVGNRAIADPSEEMAELVRELLVSEFDNQIGFAKSADKFLSANAVSFWLEAPGRLRSNCKITLAKQATGKNPTQVNKPVDIELIKRASCGDITTFDKPFEIDEHSYKMNEKQRRKFAHALYESKDKAKITEERFARLASNKREAYGRETIEKDWRPSLTLGTVISTFDTEEREFFMCITRACDMVRLSGQTKSVVLVRLEQLPRKFNLVMPITKDETVKLFVPREFSDMRKIEFKVNSSVRRITATRKIDGNSQYFLFQSSSPNMEYQYLGELRYLRAVRDVDEMIKKSTAIGIADSEWLRLTERVYR